MSTDPVAYATVTPDDITALLAQFQAPQRAPASPPDEIVHRIVLDCRDVGILTLVWLTDTDGAPLRILEWFAPDKKPQRIALTATGLDALTAWWQGEQGGTP